VPRCHGKNVGVWRRACRGVMERVELPSCHGKSEAAEVSWKEWSVGSTRDRTQDNRWYYASFRTFKQGGLEDSEFFRAAWPTME